MVKIVKKTKLNGKGMGFIRGCCQSVGEIIKEAGQVGGIKKMNIS